MYTGEDTKMSKNSKMTSNKFSTVEKSMNKYLLFFLLLLLCQVILCTLLKYYVSMDRPNCTSLPWYLKYEGFPEGECIVVDFENLSQDLLSFLVLFNYIIPISLYVTLELQKFCGSMFLVWDVQLYDAEMDQPAKCNSSDLNEELGQVSDTDDNHVWMSMIDFLINLSGRISLLRQDRDVNRERNGV